MADCIAQLREIWQQQGRRVFDVPGGMGVEFDDGRDVWWLLPGEPTSSVPLDDSAAIDPAHLTDLFQQVNQRRKQVLHVIRHYLASQRCYLRRGGSGSCPVMTESGMSSPIEVGACLTRQATQEPDVRVLVQRRWESFRLVHKPSLRRIERHLQAEGDPPDERPWPQKEPMIELPATPLHILRMMGLCKALEDESALSSPEALIAAAEPKGKIGQALLRLAERLPNATAAYDLGSGAMDIEFADGLDEYSVQPKSRALATRIRTHGPERAGDLLAEEYEQLNRDRGRILQALKAAMHARGYRLNEQRTVLHFGRRYREVAFEAGEPLTTSIRKHGAEQAVRRMLAAHPDLADAVVAPLQHGITAKEPLIEIAELPPAPPAAPHLPELDERACERIDHLARTILDEYLQDREVLLAYSDPMSYRPGVDTWASPEAWLRLAQRHAEGEYPRPDARLIRIELGDRSDEDRWLKQLQAMEPHHEVWADEVTAVWRYRHRVPETAHRWFDPRPEDDVPYCKVRARLGDPVAVCRVVMDLLNEDGFAWEQLVDVGPHRLRWFLPETMLEQWHEQALRWARDRWQWDFGGDSEVLAAAAAMGWTDVADTLQGNPYVVPGLLNSDSEEPVLIGAGKLVLAWSRLRPSPWLARLVGYGLAANSAKDTTPLAQRLTSGMIDAKSGREIAEQWFLQARRPLAIAWTRCRQYLADPPRQSH